MKKTLSHLLFTDNMDRAVKEVKENGGHVTQIFTDNIFVASAPKAIVESLKLSSLKAKLKHDKKSALYVHAWRTFKLEERKSKKEKVLNWAEIGYKFSQGTTDNQEADRKFKFVPSSTSSYMIGSIAVGLIIVTSDNEVLKFSDEEIATTISKVITACEALAKFEPKANLTFIHQTNIFKVNVPNSPSPCTNPLDCENPWRNPILELLGCSSGREGVVEYNKRLIYEKKTKWAYTAFITKYTLSYPGYAAAAMGQIYMNYDIPGYGPENLHKVFAHETCHVFGASDEYDISNCSCETKSGYFDVPNYNCVNCKPDIKKVSCLMDMTDLSNICEWTRAQLGWPYALIAEEQASSYWAFDYQKNVTFTDKYTNYLFAHSTSEKRWFISELTANGKNISTELKNGSWANYYDVIVMFSKKTKNYLFCHSSSENNWFICKISRGGITDDLASGSWGNFYGTAAVFSENDKNYLFAQSKSEKKWFISELTPNGDQMKTELASGKFENYYNTAVVFKENGKNYLFAQTDGNDNKWFISELTPKGDKMKTELASGKWGNFYGSVVAFSSNGQNFLFAHSTSGNRWFISNLTANNNKMNIELANGKWNQYYGTPIIFQQDGKNYMFAQSPIDNRWFIS